MPAESQSLGQGSLRLMAQNRTKEGEQKLKGVHVQPGDSWERSPGRRNSQRKDPEPEEGCRNDIAGHLGPAGGP